MRKTKTSSLPLKALVEIAAHDRTTLLSFDTCQLISESLFNSLVSRTADRLAPTVSVPRHFLVQLLHIEDKRFILHPGVDPIAVVRAMAANGTRTGVLQGASTITKQLYNVRQDRNTVYGARRRGLRNKLRQATWALAEEARRSKFKILEEYLSTIYWGFSYQGIDEAASGYLGTTREKLSVAQSFFLAERLASLNLALPSRIGSLLRRHAIMKLFSHQREARDELVVIYDKHFQCGNKIHKLLTTI
jgi:membrane peptidoglycan carboxypeptidase